MLRLRSFPQTTGTLIVVLGVLVLGGWLFDFQILKSVFPGLVPMKANTAVCFILAGISLLLQAASAGPANGRNRTLARLASGLVLGVGVLTLAEYIFRCQLGLDQLLFRESAPEAGNPFPGRMAPASALNFILLGLALSWLDTSIGKAPHWPAQYCTLAVALTTVLAFIGYFYGVEPLYQIAPYTTIALHTAIAFWLVCSGILLARPNRGLMRLFTGERLGSVMARRMLPAAIGIVLVAGWLRVLGQRAGLYGLGLGSAMFATVLILVLTALAGWVARELNLIDAARQRQSDALEKSERREHARRIELEALMEVVPAIVWIADDPECQRITGNQAALAMLRVRPGGNLSKTAPAQERPEHFQVFQDGKLIPDTDLPMQVAAREARPVLSQELELRFTDGTSLWIYGNAVPLLSTDATVRGVVAAFVDITTLKRAEQEVNVSREDLRRLAARLEVVREEERTAIAREIHDVLAQELTRLKVDVVWLRRHLGQMGAGLEPGVVQERLAGMVHLTDTAISSVQKIATELRPVVLDTLGLSAAIEWQANDFAARTGIKCQVVIPDKELALKRDITTAMFRILQESLTNVLRHAQATRIEIHLEHNSQEMVLSVRDNGKGIAAADLNNPHSIGLVGMRERAALLGGECRITPLPSKGTEVEVRLPFSSTQDTKSP